MVLCSEVETRVLLQKHDLRFYGFEFPLKFGHSSKLNGRQLSFPALHQALHGPGSLPISSMAQTVHGRPCLCPLRFFH